METLVAARVGVVWMSGWWGDVDPWMPEQRPRKVGLRGWLYGKQARGVVASDPGVIMALGVAVSDPGVIMALAVAASSLGLEASSWRQQFSPRVGWRPWYPLCHG